MILTDIPTKNKLNVWPADTDTLIDLPTKTELKLYPANTGKGPAECVPKKLELNRAYNFYITGDDRHLYPLDKDIPLIVLHENKPSKLIAMVRVTEIVHEYGLDLMTMGKYLVKKVL